MISTHFVEETGAIRTYYLCYAVDMLFGLKLIESLKSIFLLTATPLMKLVFVTWGFSLQKYK